MEGLEGREMSRGDVLMPALTGHGGTAEGASSLRDGSERRPPNELPQTPQGLVKEAEAVDETEVAWLENLGSLAGDVGAQIPVVERKSGSEGGDVV